jgi:hypothetical protein
MNEHELSNLLHEAAGDATVSSTASRRVLRRTRLRMATTGAIALSLVALLAGGSFALATRQTVAPEPNLKPAGPVVTPDPQHDLLLTEADEVFLAEVEGADSLWTFTAQDRDGELCLNSTTYRRTEIGDRVDPSGFGAASGIGDCVPLGVSGDRHLGFYMWDSSKTDRLEVLGAVSTDVARLELQESNASDEVVTVIKAPDELGDERNFFYLWLPLNEVGTLVAYDQAGNVLQESDLCFEPGAQDVSCTVGKESAKSGTNVATEKMMMNRMRLTCRKGGRHSDRGEDEMGVTLDEALQAWLDGAGLNSARLDQVNLNFLSEEDLDVKSVGPNTRVVGLPPNGEDYVIVALMTRVPASTGSEVDQWKLDEVVYCPDLIDP